MEDVFNYQSNIKIFTRKRFLRKTEYKFVVYHSDGRVYDECNWQQDVSFDDMLEEAKQIRFCAYEMNTLR